MTIKEWIEVARNKLEQAKVFDWRFNNLLQIEEVNKALNEIEELNKENQQ